MLCEVFVFATVYCIKWRITSVWMTEFAVKYEWIWIFFYIRVVSWYGKKIQGHNHSENAKYVNSLARSRFLFSIFLFATQKYVYLVGLICRFTSSSFEGTQNSSYSTAHRMLHTHTFSMAEVMPSLLYLKKKERKILHGIFLRFVSTFSYHRHRYFCLEKETKATL